VYSFVSPSHTVTTTPLPKTSTRANLTMLTAGSPLRPAAAVTRELRFVALFFVAMCLWLRELRYKQVYCTRRFRDSGGDNALLYRPCICVSTCVFANRIFKNVWRSDRRIAMKFSGTSSNRLNYEPTTCRVPKRPNFIPRRRTPPLTLPRSLITPISLSVWPHSWCWSREKEGRAVEVVPRHLGCTLEVFHVHGYQDHFIQPSVFL